MHDVNRANCTATQAPYVACSIYTVYCVYAVCTLCVRCVCAVCIVYSTHIVECGHAMHCRNRKLAEQQELATSTACVEQGGRDQLPVSLQSFIDR